MVSNILFDLDGTLTDPKEGITKCIQYALKQLGRPPRSESELNNFIGPPIHLRFQELLDSDDNDLINKTINFYRERYSEVGFLENVIYPGIPELLSFLHENSYKLYVVTIKPRIYAEKIVKHFSLSQWLSHVYGPNLDEYPENKTNLIKTLLNDFALVPEESVVVGDRKEDIIAGRLNGTITIGVTYGYGGIDEIVDSGPDYICNSPYEIQQAILNH